MGHRRGGFQRKITPSVAGSEMHTREAIPTAQRTKDGAQILCPFCVPTHPLDIGQFSPCGTFLKVTAVQNVIPARVVRREKLICVKCKQGGGEMVKYMNGYIHLADCMPGTKLLRTKPDYNILAGLVFKMPQGIQKQIARFAGYPQQVKEITPDGAETGKIAGYFFLKGQSNAPRTPPDPSTG